MRIAKFIAIILVAPLAAAQAQDNPEITPEKAREHVGENVTVTGTAERINTASGGNTFINMGGPGRDAPFTVFIPSGEAETVGDVKQYQGKTISVSGKITTFREKPQIVVTSADQIKVKEEAAPQASASPGGTGTPKSIP